MSNLQHLKALDEFHRKLQKIDVLMDSGKLFTGWRALKSLITELEIAKNAEYKAIEEEASGEKKDEV